MGVQPSNLLLPTERLEGFAGARVRDLETSAAVGVLLLKVLVGVRGLVRRNLRNEKTHTLSQQRRNRLQRIQDCGAVRVGLVVVHGLEMRRDIVQEEQQR